MDFRKYLTVKPYPYQREGAEFALSSYYCLIGDEMGLGKTLQALIVAFYMISQGKKVLIVVPAFLRVNWWLEIVKFSKHFHEVTLIETFKELEKWTPYQDITIISYTMALEAEFLYEWADMVIADEAHYLKNIDTDRTVKFHKYIYENMPERLMLLTGTPIPNGTVEFYSLLRLLGYVPSPTNGKNVFTDYEIPYAFYKDFANEVEVRISRSRTVTQYEGIKNTKKLKSYLKGKYIRRKCKDVLDLPPLVERDILVSYKENSKLLRDFKQFNSEDRNTPSSKAESALLKAPFSVEYAQNLHAQGKGPVVVFTDHIDSCDYIAKQLDCPQIKGAVSMKKRAKLVSQFQAGELDYIAITIGAGAEGVNLFESAETVVNDASWIPAKNEQLRKRTHRLGQTKTCTIHNILGSVQDKKILRNLRKKMKVIGEIL